MRENSREPVIGRAAGEVRDPTEGQTRAAGEVRNPTESQSKFAGVGRVPPEARKSPEGQNDRDQLDELYTAAYDELRRLAASVAGEERYRTLNPTALANEAWLKLAASPHLRWSSPMHFKRIAARAMRQVLVEAARRRAASKRGGEVALVTFDDALESRTADARQVLAIDEALHDLARFSPRQALMVESRFFGGMDIPETAELLQVSEATVQRDWRAARAWLARELRSE